MTTYVTCLFKLLAVTVTSNQQLCWNNFVVKFSPESNAHCHLSDFIA